jgi:hypothetical protein
MNQPNVHGLITAKLSRPAGIVLAQFWPLTRAGRVYLQINTGVNSFWREIVTGNEQGNNRRDNKGKYAVEQIYLIGQC